MNSSPIRNFLYLLVIVFVVTMFYSAFTSQKEKIKDVSITKVVEQVKDDKVESIKVSGNRIEIKLKDGTKEKSVKETDTSIFDYGIDPDKVKVSIEDTESRNVWISIISTLLPILLIGGFIFFRKHKSLLGWMFVMLGIFGLVLASVVKWLYPNVM